jgi:hypothetical protein
MITMASLYFLMTLLADDAVHCPPTIAVKQQLAAPVPGWSVTSDGMPHQLAGLTFFEGKPEDKASLAPDSGTNVVLTRELPRSTRSCSITYTTGVTLAGLPVIEKVDCK